jgi:hypothetical protein
MRKSEEGPLFKAQIGLRRRLQDSVISGISISCQNLLVVKLHLTRLPIYSAVTLRLFAMHLELKGYSRWLQA